MLRPISKARNRNLSHFSVQQRLRFILTLKINQGLEGSELQTKVLKEIKDMKGSCFDEENDEVYLLFSNHIQSLSGSLKIAYEQSFFFQYGWDTPFFMNMNQDQDEKYFIFFNEEYPKLEVIKVDLNGKIYRKLIHTFDRSSNPSYFSSFNHHDGLMRVEISGGSDSDTEVYIASNLHVVAKSFLIDEHEYKFLKFGEKKDHIFVYKKTCPGCSYSVCYCKCLGVISEEVVGCYSKGIYSLHRIKEFQMPDGQQYFLFGNVLINQRRKDNNTDDDQTLYFPNDIYSTIDKQFGYNNSFISSHSGQIVEIVQFPNEDGSLGKEPFGTKIMVEGPQVVIHPGILAGVVFGSFLVLSFLGFFIFLCCKLLKKDSQKDTDRRPVNRNKNNHPNKNLDNQRREHSPNNSSENIVNKLELALDREQRMAQRMSKEEKCCICLEMGCTTYLKCVHFFHQNCIVQWLNRNSKCPVCQKSANKKEIIKLK